MLVIVFVVAYHVPCKQQYQMTNDQQEKHLHVNLKNHQINNISMTKWPSFNANSYVYILGLFYKQLPTILTIPEERAMFMSAILLSQEMNITLNGKQFAYRLEETNGRDVIGALYATCLSISERKIIGIIGPSASIEAKTIARFSSRAGLPVLGYSITEPELSDRNAYKTFYRMSPSDIITAHAILKLFQKYKWNSTNIIYQGDSYGQGGLQALAGAFSKRIKISREIKYNLFTDRIENFRFQLENSPSRIVLVWATPNITTKIIQLALEEGNILAPNFLWILTAATSRMQLNGKQFIGMLAMRSASPHAFDIPTNKTLLQHAIKIWQTYDNASYPGDEKKIDAYALYAFDSAWMLISAFIKLCQQRPNDCVSLVNTSRCFTTRLINRDKLHEIMQTMDFLGVSGYVKFIVNTTDRFIQDNSHFIIDNLQPLNENTDKLRTVEVLRLNGSTINETCDSMIQWIELRNETQWTEYENKIRWPKGYDKIPVGYARLENQVLNITVYISPPFYMEKFIDYGNGTNGTEPEGYIYDLILLLETRMKFHKNIIVAPIETSYNELVNCVENGTYHIVMADLTKTANRLDQIDFSVSIYDNTMRMVVRKSKQMQTPMMAFLQPFHYSLWLGIFFIIYLFSMFLIAIFEFIDGKGRPTPVSVDISVTGSFSVTDIYHESRTETLFRSMYHTAGSLMQTGSELIVRTTFGRFQTLIIWSMSVILVALYTSNMVQYFTIAREKPWLQNIEDLRMCRAVKCNRIGVVQNSQHAEYFNKEVMHGMEVNYYRLNHPNECYKKLLDYQIDVAIVDSSGADYLTQTHYCDLEVAGLPFGSTNFGVAIPKQWPYKDDLDKHLMDLKAGRDIDIILAKWFQQRNCDRKNENKNIDFHGRLTLLQTRGLFIVFSVLTAINIILFVCRHLPVNNINMFFRSLISSLSNQQPIQHDIESSNLPNNNHHSVQQTRTERVQSLSN